MDGLTSNSMRMMERSMEFLWTKQAALLDNIANAETPNYKAKLVTFEESFQESLEAADQGRNKQTKKAMREAIEGASCELVENGRLAVERFQRAGEGEFDAILMDVQMPVMNGHEAARAIRALEREDAGRIPIIAMTANAFSEDEKAALDAGMDAHVAKPLNMDLLKKVIRQCVRRKEDL